MSDNRLDNGDHTARDDAIPMPDPRNVRVLKIIVIVLGVLIVLAILVIFATIAYRAANPGDGGAAAPRDGAPPELAIPLAEGATVARIALDGPRMAIHITNGGDDEIVVVDTRRGTVLSRIRLDGAGAAGQAPAQ